MNFASVKSVTARSAILTNSTVLGDVTANTVEVHSSTILGTLKCPVSQKLKIYQSNIGSIEIPAESQKPANTGSPRVFIDGKKAVPSQCWVNGVSIKGGYTNYDVRGGPVSDVVINPNLSSDNHMSGCVLELGRFADPEMTTINGVPLKRFKESLKKSKETGTKSKKTATQTLVLHGTRVADITFHGGNGVIILSNGAEVTGTVTDGIIQKV